ncbi:MAG: hypothetical protein KJO07_08210 [Deltaproteobacteria bacterium]|nr:hypothetical protein [Deltaproteobacteria bacterium]
MSIHWPSFLLGLSALPVLFLVAVALHRIHQALRGPRSLPQTSAAATGSHGLEPLRFTPRLIGQLRQPLETDDQAQAS